jgi:hypothetical protein
VINLELLDFIIREQGCVVCFALGLGIVPCAKHHLLTTQRHGTGKRRGERAVVGLCDYHHQGQSQVGSEAAAQLYPVRGPSYADQPREFRGLWPDEKLEALQAARIDEWRSRQVGITWP